MHNDLVTVVIPAYNHQEYVQETINSIINQSYKNIELIIFNDGSTDHTDANIKERLHECNKRFTRFAYLNKNNEGLADTLNRAIDWAKGKFFYIIASDDVAFPEAIMTLHEFLSMNEEYALVVGDNQIINEKSDRCYWDIERNNTPKARAVYHTFAEFLQKSRTDFNFNSEQYGTYETLIKGNYITNGKLFRRQSLLRVGKYKPGMKLEDWYMNLQLSKYYKLKYIDEILLSYRWHNKNSVKDPAYVKGSNDAIIKNERENHRRWFEKYTDVNP